MSRSQRRKKFVDTKVQGALVRRYLMHWFLFVSGAFLLLFVWQVLVSGDPVGGMGAALHEIWLHNLPVFVVLVLLLPVLILDTIKLSNRFAGPVLRLRNSLQDWADDKPVRPITLRRGDYWSDLADSFNRAIVHSRQECEFGETADQCDPEELVEAGA